MPVLAVVPFSRVSKLLMFLAVSMSLFSSVYLASMFRALSIMHIKVYYCYVFLLADPFIIINVLFPHTHQDDTI